MKPGVQHEQRSAPVAERTRFKFIADPPTVDEVSLWNQLALNQEVGEWVGG